jgi:hypothetical protein
MFKDVRVWADAFVVVPRNCSGGDVFAVEVCVYSITLPDIAVKHESDR